MINDVSEEPGTYIFRGKLKKEAVFLIDTL
jgi:hypothetical protein